MSILVDKDTKLAVAGITGREGSFHTLNNRRYGTNVVGGINPKKAGENVEGIPVFADWATTRRRDRRQHGDDLRAAAVRRRVARSRPPRPASSSWSSSPRASRPTTSSSSTTRVKRDHPGTRVVGPNCPGILSPGKANVGIIPASFFKEGNVGVVSRSGTLTYQIGNELAQAGFGNSSIVGIGGDPVPGSSFIDIIELFEADDRDRADRHVAARSAATPRRRPPRTSRTTSPSRSSATSRASPPPRARRWATRARSSPAPPAPPPPRPRRSRPSASASAARRRRSPRSPWRSSASRRGGRRDGRPTRPRGGRLLGPYALGLLLRLKGALLGAPRPGRRRRCSAAVGGGGVGRLVGAAVLGAGGGFALGWAGSLTRRLRRPRGT